MRGTNQSRVVDPVDMLPQNDELPPLPAEDAPEAEKKAEDLGTLTLDQLMGGRDLVSQALNDPFAGYPLRDPESYYVFFLGRLVRDRVRPGKKVPHQRAIPRVGASGFECVDFVYDVGKIKRRAAIVRDPTIRAQLIFRRNKKNSKKVEADPNYALLGSEAGQLRILRQVFAMVDKGENPLVEQIMGKEED